MPRSAAYRLIRPPAPIAAPQGTLSAPALSAPEQSADSPVIAPDVCGPGLGGDEAARGADMERNGVKGPGNGQALRALRGVGYVRSLPVGVDAGHRESDTLSIRLIRAERERHGIMPG